MFWFPSEGSTGATRKQLLDGTELVQNQYYLAENDSKPVLHRDEEITQLSVCRRASSSAILFFAELMKRERSGRSVSIHFQLRREIKGLENINYLLQPIACAGVQDSVGNCCS